MNNFKYLFLFISVLFINLLNAQLPGVLINPTDHNLNGDWSLGMRFTAINNIIVTELGVYDENANGLNTAKPVGIWDDAGMLLGSVVVPAGTAGNLVNNFRYATLGSPVNLTAGQTYRIAALHLISAGDRYGWCGGACGQTFHPDINYLNDVFTSSGSLTFPVSSNGITLPGTAWFGANMIITNVTGTSVPTLGEWGLIILMLLLLSIGSIYLMQSYRRISWA